LRPDRPKRFFFGLYAGSPYPNGLWREFVQRICKIVRYSVELRSICFRGFQAPV